MTDAEVVGTTVVAIMFLVGFVLWMKYDPENKRRYWR